MATQVTTATATNPQSETHLVEAVCFKHPFQNLYIFKTITFWELFSDGSSLWLHAIGITSALLVPSSFCVSQFRQCSARVQIYGPKVLQGSLARFTNQCCSQDGDFELNFQGQLQESNSLFGSLTSFALGSPELQCTQGNYFTQKWNAALRLILFWCSKQWSITPDTNYIEQPVFLQKTQFFSVKQCFSQSICCRVNKLQQKYVCWASVLCMVTNPKPHKIWIFATCKTKARDFPSECLLRQKNLCAPILTLCQKCSLGQDYREPNSRWAFVVTVIGAQNSFAHLGVGV